MLTDIIVVKFGGSYLSTPEDVLTAAKTIAVAAAKGRRIVVVVSPLAGADINLYGVLTIHSSIKIFVPWRNRETALSLIKSELGNFLNQGEGEYEHRKEEKIK